ncbi:MAG: hypothetical protein HC850_08460, partial [Rhodomicrobium sp.]|nr:hypothetical protein [Rhodomicrobium sp.]
MADDKPFQRLYSSRSRFSLTEMLEEHEAAEREKERLHAAAQVAASDPLPSFIYSDRTSVSQSEPAPAPEAMSALPAEPQARAPEPDEFVERLNRKYAKSEKPVKTRSWKYRAARFTLYWGAIAAIWFAVVLAGAVTVYTLMAEDPLKAGLSKQPAKITILAENNKVISEKGLRRSHVKLQDMP